MKKQYDNNLPAFHPGHSKYNAEAERRANYIGRQLAGARKAKGLTLVGLSQLLEDYGVSVSNVAIHKWEQGASTPNAYQLLALSQALDLGEDMTYFMGSASPALNEEGLRKVAEYRSDLIATGRYTPKVYSDSLIRYIEMPVSDLPVSAGTGTFLEEDRFEMVSFPEHTIPQGADFGVRITGDSMEPVYHDGQIVWVRRCSTLRPGEVGLFLYDGEGYIKQYGEQDPDDAALDSFLDSSGVLHKQPVLISYNPAYPPRPVSPQLSFSIAGKILN